MELRLRIPGSVWRLGETCAETTSTEDHTGQRAHGVAQQSLRSLWHFCLTKAMSHGTGAVRGP